MGFLGVELEGAEDLFSCLLDLSCVVESEELVAGILVAGILGVGLGIEFMVEIRASSISEILNTASLIVFSSEEEIKITSKERSKASCSKSSAGGTVRITSPISSKAFMTI